MVDFYPQNIGWGWQMGYSRQVGKAFFIDARYDMRDKEFLAEARGWISPKWMLRYEYRWADQIGEVGIRYKLHDFLSMEYVISNNDSWLRFIGDF